MSTDCFVRLFIWGSLDSDPRESLELDLEELLPDAGFVGSFATDGDDDDDDGEPLEHFTLHVPDTEALDSVLDAVAALVAKHAIATPCQLWHAPTTTDLDRHRRCTEYFIRDGQRIPAS